jgi:hypothetical protein
MDASRVNTVCRWSDSVQRMLDLIRAEEREHLRVDAKLAGELGLRFADVRYRNVPTRAAPLLNQCREALYDSIIARHGVARADIDRATFARVWWADIVLVFLPISLLTLVAMDRITTRICRAFEADDRGIARVSLGFFVPVVALLALGVTQFWAMGVEAWLLRNGHVSFRMSQIPAVAHAYVTYFAALILCLIVGSWRFVRTPLGNASRSNAGRLGLYSLGR